MPLVYDQENTGSSYAPPVMPDANELPVVRELPDALEGVTGFSDWAKRRNDIGHMIQHYGIGTKPMVEKSQVEAHMVGDTALVVNDDRPIATMTYHEKQVNDYGQWGPHHERGEHPFDRLYPTLTANGAYSEWAWGLSRLIDGLQLLGEDATRIDMRHIGVTGCSYAGKMALYY